MDFYKSDHRRQYPQGTNKVYSNFTPRSARLFKGSKDYDDKVVVFGLQMFIKDYLIEEWNDSFFSQDKDKIVARYKRRMDTSLGEDAIDVSHIEDLHDLGYLPIKIKALPEGTRAPIKVPVLTITNTIDEFFWLVNYLETVMSTELWKPMTTATIAYEYKRTFLRYAEMTGASMEFIPFQGHDFSARGLSNREDGYKASIGHLTSFCGTDTVRAIDGAEDFYNADATKELIGASVPATEHSVMSLSGPQDEIGTFRRLITELYPTGIVSIVSDTWDFWKVITEYTVELKEEIEARDGKVVFRPDSGDPVDIICGTNPYSNATVDPAERGAIQLLWDVFGGTVNDKGYKTLNQKVGLIYGDSITLERQERILAILEAKGFASDNIVFGIGSYSYQYNTRDTFGFAMKATYGEVEGVGREIFKDPITDSGTKKSARGMLQVFNNRTDAQGNDLMFDGKDELALNDQCTAEQEARGLLEVVFEDGKLVKETSLKEIRERLDGEC